MMEMSDPTSVALSNIINKPEFRVSQIYLFHQIVHTQLSNVYQDTLRLEEIVYISQDDSSVKI